jgi:hypothetical protein
MPSYVRRVQIPGKTSQQLYDLVSQDVDRFLGQAGLGKFQIERQPEKKELHVKSTLFSAVLTCGEEQMELHAQLSLLAVPLKSKIDASINHWLTKTFNLTAKL